MLITRLICADYENTTQEDQMQQAAEDLVNQQTITQYSSLFSKMEAGEVTGETPLNVLAHHQPPSPA